MRLPAIAAAFWSAARDALDPEEELLNSCVLLAHSWSRLLLDVWETGRAD
jgi:hypothetical protein